MIDWLYYCALGVTGILTVWFLVDTARWARPGLAHAIGIGVLEIALLAVIIGGFTQVPSAPGDGKALFFSYLVVAALTPVAAFLWGRIDRSRWGIGTVAIAPVVVAALLLRCDQMWEMSINVVT
ncbi:hypothetical protein [Haloglycomyces albus]|uniref:hypothetical protein n=1 Tax=Haloglycomyces albus TaxID=526067 RepID=UPI00046D2CCF|nr:hypothetical protein [Haloglycomyces albus]